MNEYYEKIKIVKQKVKEYLTEIFNTYNNELTLCLGNYNLLSNQNNCIETSTATGFLMEEFIVSKLEEYTSKNDGVSELKIFRKNDEATTKSSYDCYIEYLGILFYINIKIEKDNATNDAIAAINLLHNDYVLKNPQKEKSFIVLKTHYNFGMSKNDGQKKIMIDSIETYALEEINFSLGHKQDNRSWSKTYKENSGRLLASKGWREQHKENVEKISYKNTKQYIKNIFESNI